MSVGGGISSFETGRARFIAGKIQRILFLYRHKCPAFVSIPFYCRNQAFLQTGKTCVFGKCSFKN